MKKRILYIEQSRVGTTGGSHASLLELIKRLNRLKYEPIVIFYEENSLLQEFREVVSRVIIYRRPKMLNVGKRFPWLKSLWLRPLFLSLMVFQKAYNFGLSFRPFVDFAAFLRREKIDLVHLNNSFYIGYDWLIASKLCRVKCITHQRGLERSPATGRFFIGFYDGIVCVSEHIKQALRRNRLPVDERVCVIYNGLNIGSFMKRIERDAFSIRDEFGLEENEILIGVVGNILHWKGQKVVIDAVSLLRKQFDGIRCMIIGDSAEEPEYFESLRDTVMKKKLSKNVLFVGFRKDVPDLMNALDILIHSSIKPEPFGRVILEGMTLGKPVIATNMGGPAEMIEDNVSGLLVRPNDPEAMAEKIQYLLENRRVRQRLGDVAARTARDRFDMALIASQVERVYESLLTDGAGQEENLEL